MGEAKRRKSLELNYGTPERSAWRKYDQLLKQLMGDPTLEHMLKVFSCNSNYADWGDIATRICERYLLADREMLTGDRQMTSLIYHKAVTTNAPIFWLSPELCRAFLNTQLPDKLPELSRPFRAFHLMLPQDVAGLNCPGIGNTFNLVVVHKRKGDPAELHEFPGGISVTSEAQLIDRLEVASMMSDELVMPSSVPLDGGPSALEAPESISSSTDGWRDVNTQKAINLQLRLIYLAYQSILWLQRDPMLVTEITPRATATAATVHESKRSFHSRRWLGENYRVRRSASSSSSSSSSQASGGSHASPATHWRAGHIRLQPCGPKKQDRKVIWIEPTLVG